MTILRPEDVEYIAVHCSATYPSQNIGAGWINDLHISKGWTEIGYHFVIRRQPSAWGIIEYGGRMLNEQGAHVYGFNDKTIGICLVGGLKEGTEEPEMNFMDAQFTALKNLLSTLRLIFPDVIIQGHRDFPNVNKDCPCFDVKSFLRGIEAGEIVTILRG